ncbi:MAG: aminopeptidase P family protein [Clostridia bacterium]|nr:aminopeptidase P family protein [Clostridia bacterium]
MSKLTKFKAKMAEQGIDAAIISSYVNIRYITNFDFQDGYVLVTKGKSYVLTDFRYIEAAKAAVNAEEFDILTPDNGMGVCMCGLLEENGCKTVAYEDATLSCAGYERFKKALVGMEMVPGASAIADGLRLFKDLDEIEKMKKAQAITDAAFAHILEFITPNMTEIDVALELEFFMRRMGSEGVAFDTIAVSGSASSLPHGVPRNVKLEKGFFTMDYGARVDGYCSDMTRTVVLGKADADMKKLYNTVLTAQKAALEHIKEGNKCRDCDKIARDIIDNAGYQGRFGHSLGHGVGMYIHEAPSLSSRAPEDMILTRGHVVTDEPGIYIEGLYGCRIEDMIAIMPDDGSTYDFTHSPKEMIELF